MADELSRLKAENEELKGRMVLGNASSSGGNMAKEYESLLCKHKLMTEVFEKLRFAKTEYEQVGVYQQEREENRRLRDQNDMLKKQLATSSTVGIDEASRTDFLQGLQRLATALDNLTANVSTCKPAGLSSKP